MTFSSSPGQVSSHFCKFSTTSKKFQLGEISNGSTNLLVIQTPLAWSQNQSKWLTISSSFPHNSQIPLGAIFHFARFVFVARMSRPALQAKCLIFCRTFRCQIAFPIFLQAKPFKQSPMVVCYSSSKANT